MSRANYYLRSGMQILWDFTRLRTNLGTASHFRATTETALFKPLLNMNKEIIKVTLGSLGPIDCHRAPFSHSPPF